MEGSIFYNGKFELANPILFQVIWAVAFLTFTLLFSKQNKTDSSTLLHREYTESLRGVSILLIITHHFAHNLVKPSLLPLFYDLGHFGVGIFLCLSGYGLAESYQSKGLNGFFYPKLLRIFLPFLMANLFFLLMNQTVGGKIIGFADMPFILVGLIIFDANYWYMQYLFCLYFLFWLLFNLKMDDKYKLLMLFVFSFTILLSDIFPVSARVNSFTFFIGVALSLNKTKISNLISSQTLKVYSVLLICMVSCLVFVTLTQGRLELSRRLFFVMAVLFAALITLRSGFDKKEKMALLLFSILGSAYISLSADFAPSFILSLSVSNYVVTFMLLFGVVFVKWRSLFLEFVGSISYELYLLHGMFMVNYDFVLHRYPAQYSFFVYLAMIMFFSFLTKKTTGLVAVGTDKMLTQLLK